VGDVYLVSAAVLRYTSDGSLDQTFGTGGITLTGSNGEHFGAVAIQSDGKIVAAGSILARYLGDDESPALASATDSSALSSDYPDSNDGYVFWLDLLLSDLLDNPTTGKRYGVW
jgi:hypothetical protein